MTQIDFEKKIKEEVKKLINFFSEKERSGFLAGIMPDPLNNLIWINLSLIWRKCQANLKDIQKITGGEKLIKLFQKLEKLRYFEDK